MTSVVILGAKRTPMGSLLGELKDFSAPQLGAYAIEAAISQAKCNKNEIDEILMGCVLSAGQGQAPARQAGIYADLPAQVGATTINKMCGSGMKAIMLGHDSIQAATNNLMIAGGMESMTQAPYLLTKARAGYRLGHAQTYDHMFLDGLEDAYDKGKLMGVFAEQCAERYAFSREAQDAFAIESLTRAQKATQAGYFAKEMCSIHYETKQGAVDITTDEGPAKARVEKIPQLKPAFEKNGTVTAANSSSISDGAAALVIASEEYAHKQGYTPIAKIIGHATHAQEPAWFTTAPVAAIKKLLAKIQWQISDVNLFEINEAFAVVTMAAMKDLNLPAEKVNIYGGACALGHPIGASGARIVVTLINALQQTKKRRGIASLCIGGGEATAIAIELCN